MSNTYIDSLGNATFKFKANGTLIHQVNGVETELHYDFSGDTIKILAVDGCLVLKVMPNGTLEGPCGIVLHLKE